MSYWALLRTIPEGSRQIQIQCWNRIILIQYNFIVTETPLWVEDTATPPVTPLFLCPFRLSSRLHKAQRLWYCFPLKVWIVPLCLRMNWPIHHGGPSERDRPPPRPGRPISRDAGPRTALSSLLGNVLQMSIALLSYVYISICPPKETFPAQKSSLNIQQISFGHLCAYHFIYIVHLLDHPVTSPHLTEPFYSWYIVMIVLFDQRCQISRPIWQHCKIVEIWPNLETLVLMSWVSLRAPGWGSLTCAAGLRWSRCTPTTWVSRRCRRTTGRSWAGETRDWSACGTRGPEPSCGRCTTGGLTVPWAPPLVCVESIYCSTLTATLGMLLIYF